MRKLFFLGYINTSDIPSIRPGFSIMIESLKLLFGTALFLAHASIFLVYAYFISKKCKMILFIISEFGHNELLTLISERI